jgi:hypothetical protein
MHVIIMMPVSLLDTTTAANRCFRLSPTFFTSFLWLLCRNSFASNVCVCPISNGHRFIINTFFDFKPTQSVCTSYRRKNAVRTRVCIYFYAPAAESFRRFAYKTFRMGRVIFFKALRLTAMCSSAIAQMVDLFF